MYVRSLIAAATLALATPAFADSEQLALSLGVNPGVHTPSELSRIKSFQNGEEAERFRAKEAQRHSDGDLSMRSRTAPASLLGIRGLAAGVLSASEWQLITNAVEENNSLRIKHIINGKKPAPSVDDSSGAKRQLAYGLGVNAANYTTRELVVLRAEVAARDED